MKFCWKDALAAAVGVLIGALAILFWLASTTITWATWKPEYASAPKPVIAWFDAQKIATEHARVRLSQKSSTSGLYTFCCNHAERLRTKFEPNTKGEWSYYPDPACTTKGCKLEPIMWDVIHREEIHALEAADDALPEFEAMRREGVLMIYNDEPFCFWPPEPGL